MSDLQTIMAQRKLNAQAESIELPKAFLDKFPHMKPDKAEKLFRRYVDVVFKALIPKLPFLQDGSITYLSMHGLLNECGEFNYRKKRYWVWNEFKFIFPLFTVLETGSNLKVADSPFAKNTKIQINERSIRMLLAEMALSEKSAQTVFEELYKGVDFSRDDVSSIAIDMENLQRFIDNCEYELCKEDLAPNYVAKLRRSLYQATLVFKVGLHMEKETRHAALPLVPSPSPFGRIYYKGLNIQNVTKEVRAAILGHHFQYDMNAAVYSIKLALLNMLCHGENNLVGTPVGTYTREYLNEKDAIRKRLAKECFEGVELSWEYKLNNIKQALTAIGFGARTSSGFWIDDGEAKGPALAEILKSPQVRERFLADPWVKSFIAEQKMIEDAIIDDMKASEGYDAICDIIRARNGANGRVTKSLLLAYQYQQWEKILMDKAEAVLSDHGISILATVHDALIVREAIPTKVLDELHVVWAEFSSHIRFEAEEVGDWQDVSVKKAREAADYALEQHRAWIKHEEASTVDRLMKRRAQARLAELKAESLHQGGA